VPAAVAVHDEQLSSDDAGERRRIVELARNRDAYMRKHHSPAAARTVRWLTAWAYALRALAAVVLPGHSARRYCATSSRRCARSAERACERRPSATTAKLNAELVEQRADDARVELAGAHAFELSPPRRAAIAPPGTDGR